MTDQEITMEKKSIFTPFNIISAIIIIVGLVLTYLRFTKGLGAVTNLDDTNPWGIWIGFDLLTGVALAAGGYVTAAAVEIFGMKKYHSAVRPAILTGFLGYSLVVFALLYDVGRPWRLPYPFFISQGVTSVMFEVGACVALYLTVLFLEFSPAALEWLGLKKLCQTDYCPDHPGCCSFNPASIIAGGHVPAGAVKTAPALVFALFAGLFLCLLDCGRIIDGALRGNTGAPALPSQDG